MCGIGRVSSVRNNPKGQQAKSSPEYCEPEVAAMLALKEMHNLDNTLIVVEHDEDTIRQANWMVDRGPYAGIDSGEVVVQGDPSG